MPRNILDRWTKLFDMIHPKWRDGRDDRFLNYIRRIVFAPMVSLQDGGINALPNKGVQGHKQEQLKITGPRVETLNMWLRQNVMHLEEVLCKNVSWKWLKIDPNPLFWIDKMW